MQTLKQMRFSGERALFGAKNLKIENSVFCDGESPLKESSDIIVQNSKFEWKYPFWYAKNIEISNCLFDEIARAGIWYSQNLRLSDCVYGAPKGLRRVKNAHIENVQFTDALETLWHCEDIVLKNISAKGPYFGLDCQNLEIENLNLFGDYCFDGCKNVKIKNSKLLSKDAFWNCENILIEDCFIAGEYFGWNSKNVTLKNCKIESLQGFCYMQNLRLENCELINTTLAFEFSDVYAQIIGEIDSVKNPRSGLIKAAKIRELIQDGATDASKTEIITELRA
ncbi:MULTISPECIES: DUF3737 family protein [unclassified Campylobacter]|uniref:DUF3737 family protein n=1 Tax=unclassified Campylobacter TaxID=2593542 RepID=UPI0022EA0215|nr:MULTISPECIES: DUF3737 family protein [unclassified Campylobacter]MDA3062941.1 DUF3737 family protein [Campylobacter sp. JMF_14 EL1]MDA3074096.1 DUF3737 family protein [Campylobacter sp. JMF_10 EL2]